MVIWEEHAVHMVMRKEREKIYICSPKTWREIICETNHRLWKIFHQILMKLLYKCGLGLSALGQSPIMDSLTTW
jgi:hypothetical protein